MAARHLLAICALAFFTATHSQPDSCSAAVQLALGSPNATVTLLSAINTLRFSSINQTLPSLASGAVAGVFPPVRKAMIYFGEENVSANSYAPLGPLFLDSLDTPTRLYIVEHQPERDLLAAVMLILRDAPQYSQWLIGGHGDGGRVASKVFALLYPKFSTLLLVAALPDEAAGRISENVNCIVLYGGEDKTVTEADVLGSGGLLPASTFFQKMPFASHSDFYFDSEEDSGCNSTLSSSIAADTVTLKLLFQTDAGPLVLGVNITILEPVSLPFAEVSLQYVAQASSTIEVVEFRRWYAVLPSSISVVVGFDKNGRAYQVGVNSNTTAANDMASLSMGILYMQGGLVDPAAYLAMMIALAELGHPCFILKPPLNSLSYTPAFDLADVFFEEVGQILVQQGAVSSWAVAGHSQGSVGAQLYATWGNSSGMVSMIIGQGTLLAAEVPADIRVVIQVGSEDRVLEQPAALNASEYDNVEVLIIEGGNHCYFGHYQCRLSDRLAGIGRLEQQQQAVEHMHLSMQQ